MASLCDLPILRKPPKKILLTNLRSSECSDRKFYKVENLRHPQIVLGGSGQVCSGSSNKLTPGCKEGAAFTTQPQKTFRNVCICGTQHFFTIFPVRAPIFCKSSAFDPKTEDLRGTCKKSTNAEVSRSPYFLHLLDIFRGKKIRQI